MDLRCLHDLFPFLVLLSLASLVLTKGIPVEWDSKATSSDSVIQRVWAGSIQVASIPAGSDALLECHIYSSGADVPVIQWERYEGFSLDNHPEAGKFNYSIVFQESSRMWISSLRFKTTTNDSGSYRCCFKTSSGAYGGSDIVNLNVKNVEADESGKAVVFTIFSVFLLSLCLISISFFLIFLRPKLLEMWKRRDVQTIEMKPVIFTVPKPSFSCPSFRDFQQSASVEDSAPAFAFTNVPFASLTSVLTVDETQPVIVNEILQNQHPTAGRARPKRSKRFECRSPRLFDFDDSAKSSEDDDWPMNFVAYHNTIPHYPSTLSSLHLQGTENV